MMSDMIRAAAPRLAEWVQWDTGITVSPEDIVSCSSRLNTYIDYDGYPMAEEIIEVYFKDGTSVTLSSGDYRLGYLFN